MEERKQALLASNDMKPVQGFVELDIPADVLWAAFEKAYLWPRWNPCFYWVRNRRLELGDRLQWVFQPIRWLYGYKMPAQAEIVELVPGEKVTWAVTVLPGFFALHTYSVESLPGGRSRFGSWEQAMGWNFRLMRRFWIAHFEYVKDRSLEGALTLEALYQRNGSLDEQSMPERSYMPLSLPVGKFFSQFRFLRLRYESLAPGMFAVFGGGGNTLVLESNGEVLVVDPKFPPYSGFLGRWIRSELDRPVTKIINTHFHFDHTQGNTEFPDAQIYAHERARDLMLARDGGWWRGRTGSLPVHTFADGAQETLSAGKHGVQVFHSGAAHTATDLWMVIHHQDQDWVVTGDILTLAHYPFIDLGEGGANPENQIRLLKTLARRFPAAVFVPGHGPLAKAADVLAFADYLEHLLRAVDLFRQRGIARAAAAEYLDLSIWNLSVSPIFHYGVGYLNAAHNARAVYELLAESD